MIPTLTDLLVASVALAVPVLVAASGELVGERAGVLTMSVEGMMLTGAFASVVGATASGSAFYGVLCGAVAGLLVGVLQAVLSVLLRADQIVTGLAANALALAGTTFGARLLLDRGTTVPGFARIEIPLLADIPVLGPALFRQTGLAYALVAAVVLLAIVTSRRTGWGIAVDAVGQDAASADRSGVPVLRVRFTAVLVVGLLSGLAGTQLALSEVHTFTDNMTAGTGYLAVVAVIAGSWRPVGVAVAAVVFGLAQALQFTLPALGVDVPFALLVMLPYVLALLAVAGFVSHSRPPAGLNTAFVRQGRLA
ncbi:nucleoside ABC transporter membrane protein [Isoptericola sp. CG 20/1183]|uniref:Nucleoside ABC transporter membrane protein n=1 Tax=Isoptericola halotolerans TaxID=300560 RepID=A0ABX5EL42_9MICO|nr:MULTISPECIES: ABC transporter permease [Isoptericola]PRZ09640.1 nucleoside ABC transporter membrane protein [Isoptericola sp. CG 20/1183]PRZ10441.1 nucleoside ABC transporter membrane protein [Isoptericola halotolerans]